MSQLAYRIETDYAGVVAELETKLSGYITPVAVSPPDGVPAEKYNYFPYFFSNKWPVLAAAELAPEGGYPAVSDTSTRLRAIRIGVRVYYPSLMRRDLTTEYTDAREAAKRKTRAVFSNWLTKFQADDELAGWVESMRIETIEMGDADRIGNPFFQPGTGTNTILWVHATQVLFEL